jgi:hypothetical protein
VAGPKEKTFDTFPGFGSEDFLVFEKERTRNPAFNPTRLVVKRKLAGLGKDLEPRLEAAGLSLATRTSLSHPYTFNAYRVDSMWVYFARSEKEKAGLRRLLGAEFKDDLDPSYTQTILLVEVALEALTTGLKVHPAAWWDAQNLKNRCTRGPAAEGARAELARLLNSLPPGFAMTMGDWRRRYEAGKVRPADIANFFQYFTPGEMWLHVLLAIPRDETLKTDAGALRDRLAQALVALAPLYRFIAWTPENDFVLAGRS